MSNETPEPVAGQHAASSPAAMRTANLLWKDFGYYALWWVLIMAALSGLMYVEQTTDFWAAKARQVWWGGLFGLVCAVLFTLAQNTWNGSRKKVLNWGFAIAIWMGMKFIWAIAGGAFT